MNAREAMHLIELRSGREGHPGYRAVAHEMHAQIAERHPAVAAAMTHVDRTPSPGSSGSSPRCARSTAAPPPSRARSSVGGRTGASARAAAGSAHNARSRPRDAQPGRELAAQRPALRARRGRGARRVAARR